MGLNMEEILNNLGIVGFLLMIVWKLLDTFVFKQSNLEDIDERLLTLENNHIVHIEGDLTEIKKDLKDVRNELIKQGNRISILETKIR
jgi:hypothetical protein